MRRIIVVALVAVVATGALILAEDEHLRQEAEGFVSGILARAGGGPKPSWGDVADKVGEFASEERDLKRMVGNGQVAPDPPAAGRRRRAAIDPRGGRRGLDGIGPGLTDAGPERRSRRGNAMPLDTSPPSPFPTIPRPRRWSAASGGPTSAARRWWPCAARSSSTSAPSRRR